MKHSILRNILGTMLMALSFGICALMSGCAINSQSAPTTQQVVDQVSPFIGDAVEGWIVFSDDQPAEAKKIDDLASEIHALASGSIDLANLQTLLDGVIAKQAQGEDAQRAQFVVNLIIRHVKAGLNLTDLSAIPDDKLQFVRAMVIEFSQAAMDAAEAHLK